MKKLVLLLVIVLFVWGMYWLTKEEEKDVPTQQTPTTNVSVIGDTQYIEITAKGGYSPRNTIAKANVPTVLSVKTNRTYDCSIALTIPVFNYRTNLQPTGNVSITIPPQQPGTVIKGMCSMGMYNFALKFN